MQSVKIPLLEEENHSSLSTSNLTVLGKETENDHLTNIPDNRRFMEPLPTSHNASTNPNSSTKPMLDSKKSLCKPLILVGRSSISSTTDEDVKNDDEQRLCEKVGQNSSMRKLPSTLFSPMSESCGSSLVEGSAYGSALATPMEISRPASRASILGPSEPGTMKHSQSQHDWKYVERQLHKSHEKEEMKRFANNDREQIRRKLAMEEDDVGDLFSEVLRFRHGGCTANGMRRSSSTSAATNSSLQICFFNNDDIENDDVDVDKQSVLTWDGGTYSNMRCKPASRRVAVTGPSPERKADIRKPATQLFVEASRLGVGEEEDEDDEQRRNLLDGSRHQEEDAGKGSVLLQQSKLQAEAKVALAQTLPMARMQMELEKMNRKKSPIVDIVGLQGGFLSDADKELTPRTLSNLNLAQLQVIFNDLHTRIENYNDLLLKFLEERDDLHMEQDAKLADIEVMTRRLKQMATSHKALPQSSSLSKNSADNTNK